MLCMWDFIYLFCNYIRKKKLSERGEQKKKKIEKETKRIGSESEEKKTVRFGKKKKLSDRVEPKKKKKIKKETKLIGSESEEKRNCAIWKKKFSEGGERNFFFWENNENRNWEQEKKNCAIWKKLRVGFENCVRFANSLWFENCMQFEKKKKKTLREKIPQKKNSRNTERMK